MADLYEYVMSTGVVIPNTSDVKTDVENEYREIFGADLSVESSTPQGRLTEHDTLFRQQVLRVCALMANSQNVRTATGDPLDAIGAKVLVYRKYAQPTQVLVSLAGVAGTIIPAGSQAKTTDGDVFASERTVQLDENGKAEVYFQSVELGQIPCPVGTLTEIVSSVSGWETINNPDPAIIGYEKESDDSYRERILYAQQLANGYNDSIKGKLSGVNGVISSWYYENYNDTAVEVDGVSVSPHSLCIIVDGGLVQDIYNAIASAKNVGCGYTAISGQSETGLGYDAINDRYVQVTFNRPEYIEVQTTITVSLNKYQGNNIYQDVKDAVVAWAQNKNPNVEGLVIGNNVNTFEIASAVSEAIPEIKIVQVVAGKKGEQQTVNGVSILSKQCALLTSDDVSVVVQ